MQPDRRPVDTWRTFLVGRQAEHPIPLEINIITILPSR